MSGKRPSKHVQPDLVEPVDPGPGLAAEQAAEITRALAVYKMTGNGVAAWVALKACILHGVAVPSGLSHYFVHIATKIEEMAKPGEGTQPQRKGAREGRRAEVARLVLGSEAGGGKSVFTRYAEVLEQRQLLALLRSEMIRLIIEPPPNRAASQRQVFELVSERTGRSYESLRALWKAEEKDFGDLKVSAMKKTLKAGATQTPSSSKGSDRVGGRSPDVSGAPAPPVKRKAPPRPPNNTR